MQLVLPNAQDARRRQEWMAAQRAREMPFAEYLRRHGVRGAAVGTHKCDEEAASLLPKDAHGAHHRALYMRVSWLSGGLLCLGVTVATLAVVVVFLMVSFAWQAQDAVTHAKEELMPHLTKVLDATDTIVTDTQASLAHLHSATESGDAIASGGAPALLALLNASAGAARHTEHLLRHPTLKVTLGDDG
tara:strand:+ start:233 stop:799 length:567 start_codon:yes stop_codon:yes gene_type:complete